MGIALMPARLGGSVLGLFGVLGLVLAAVGIYGVMAYSVAQRQRELGLRVALGADRVSVVRQVLGEGLRLALIGAAIGLIAAVGAAQLVSGMLYNVDALDPVAFVLVPVILISVAAYLCQSKALFWGIGLGAGLGIGSLQSASRGLVGLFSPVKKSGEFFGFWGLAGKGAYAVGPAIFGAISSATDSQRVAILVNVVFFVVGIVAMQFIDEKRGHRAAARWTRDQAAD